MTTFKAKVQCLPQQRLFFSLLHLMTLRPCVHTSSSSTLEWALVYSLICVK
jgi:hypothetical protein